MTENNSESDDLDLRALLRPLRRYWWLVLGIVVLTTAATYFADARKPKVYQASTSVFVNLADNTVGQFSTGQGQVVIPSTNAVSDLARLAQSSSVGAELKKALNSPASPEKLLSQVTAEPDAASDFVNITAKGATPAEVAALANAYARAFVNVGRHQVLTQLFKLRLAAGDQLAALRGKGPAIALQRQQLRSRIGELRAAKGNFKGPEQQLNPAVPPVFPVSPRPKRVALFGFLLSLLGAVIVVYLLERLDRRIEQVDDLSSAYELPLLGVVPHVGEPSLVSHEHAALDASIVESMRFLRVNLSLQALDRPIKLLLVTSAIPGEGKSTVVRNLTLAYREAGVDVVAVDADLRRPSLATTLGSKRESAGLTNVLIGEASVSDAVVRAEVELPGVARESGAPGPSIGLLPSGGHAANPPAILGSARMAEVLHELAANHELVIIDSPPLLAVSDTLPLLSIVDGVILVARVGHTKREAIRRVKAVLARLPTARVFGIVADDVKASSDYEYIYGSGGYSKGEVPAPDLAKARD